MKQGRKNRPRKMSVSQTVDFFLKHATQRMPPKNPAIVTDCWAFPGKPAAWEVTGINGVAGYVRPHIVYQTKTYSFSRFLMMNEYGELQTHQHACHSCWNGDWCVNPEHLYLGDHRTNARDRSEENDQHVLQPYLQKIWQLREAGYGAVAIGRELGLHITISKTGRNCSAVASILRGSNWREESEEILSEMGYEVEWSRDFRYLVSFSDEDEC